MTKEEMITYMETHKTDLMRTLAEINGKHDEIVREIAFINHFLSLNKEQEDNAGLTE